MRQLVMAGAAVCIAVSLIACGGGGGKKSVKRDPTETGAQQAACNDAPNFADATGVRAPTDQPAGRLQALPPEPVSQLLPKARFVVEAKVGKVLFDGKTPPNPDKDKHLAGPIPPARCQVVRLDVTAVLTGEDPGSVVNVVKPLAPYSLKRGQPTDGLAFIVEAGDPYPIILGRYGPYPVAAVQQALGQ